MKRVALVIGNASYPEKPLDNPCNDAQDVASVLRQFGFLVLERKDATNADMGRALRDFREELYNADLGLFFFAGHGLQIDGKNYLLATDTCANDELDVEYSSMSLDKVIDSMEKSGTSTNLVVLDACRINPWEKRWHRSTGTAGLAPVYVPRGTLIAFATSPGQTAADGKGKRNGEYTSALLQHIGTPDCTIEAMFKRVRNTLSIATDGKQISWEHTSLASEFYFNRSVGSRIDVYSTTALKDALLEYDASKPSHDVIRGLKVTNWPVQARAMAKLKPEFITQCNKNNLFIVGRNIYQAACGSEHTAGRFIGDFAGKTSGVPEDKKKALLDGMLFEVFFDGSGKLRRDFKDGCFSSLFSLQQFESNTPSFEFIAECLLPHAQRFHALPGKNVEVAVDVVLEFRDDSKHPHVARICIASGNVLRPEDEEDEDEIEEPQRFKKRSIDHFEARISTELMIPLHLLSFTYSGAKKPSTLYSPRYWTVRK
ncbi:caspase family protein [Phytopseudomonas seleniipraecipitans]|uniref:Caspase domain-containing protein n=1 Tax=Phytopseudomonas seleniipraecipitans TaxID=640205 RepID=A0A1G7RPQ8_9GAMM|nr:caspase family protein [Pseudomonas seleniipraecipitans]SDG12761.1 Caspase domain-containing protein [Pseudomonas seleniipraecipitans]